MFELPDLPYAHDALEPVISRRTMEFHHDKHHAAYVNVTNELVQKSGQGYASLEEVIRASAGKDAKLFNNSAQAWNHAFFWNSMAPARQAPSGALAAAIDTAFGGLEQLKTAFVTEGVGHFASGWVWLVAEGGALKVISTHDAADTVTEAGVTPLLVCDLWEHAYSLDHQNNRKGFLETWFDTLANWEFAAVQFASAAGQGEGWRYPEPKAKAA